MNTSRAEVEVVNPLGLHLRASHSFVRTAQQFRSDITVAWDGKSADGKSILDLLLLAVTPGATLEIGAHGPDSEEAIAALRSLLGSEFAPPDALRSPSWDLDR